MKQRRKKQPQAIKTGSVGLAAESRQKVIDIHSHVFNTDYLPWVGVIKRFLGGREKLGYVVNTLAAHLPRDARIEELADSDGQALADRIDVDDVEVRALEPTIREIVSSSGALREVAPSEPGQKLRTADYRDMIATFLEMPAEEVPRLEISAVHSTQAGRLRKLWQALIWVWMLRTKSPRQIAYRLRAIFPQVDLFAHLMMDMENHYPGPAPVVHSMRAQFDTLRSELDDRRLPFLLFVAFDPFRAEVQFQQSNGSHMDIIRHAFERGCAGVKFYPPNGYAPDYNEKQSLEEGAPLPEIINRANYELFEFCQANRLPIFTHSQPGELKARDGFDRLSHPEWWKRVLKNFPNLHLCFGHAGADDWYSDTPTDPEWDKTWSGQIVQHCLTYDNVYCDFGAFSEVYHEPERSLFVKRLSDVTRLFPKLKEKILYGSDWSMIYLNPEHAQHLQRFMAIAEAAHLDGDAFFRGNAVRYLDLENFISRNSRILSSSLSAALQKVLVP
jgi:predicted TIM-barrel fold metal-dependent hydrolase